MKNFLIQHLHFGILLMLFSTVFLFSTCKKEKLLIEEESQLLSSPTEPWVMSAYKNNVKWRVYIDAQRDRDSSYGLQAVAVDTNGFFRELMTISIIPLNKIGSFQLIPVTEAVKRTLKRTEVSFSYNKMDHDAIREVFKLDTNARTNFFEITKADSIHVEGKFDVTVIGTRSQEVIRFKYGLFKAKFVK